MVLPCSHSCGLKCHWPTTQHERCCQVKVAPPCTRHPAVVTCHSVYSNTKGRRSPTADTIEEALQFYRCPKPVPLVLPCSHEETMSCADETDITEQGASYPICKRQSPLPYVHPACRHEHIVSCDELARYLTSPMTAPTCEELVSYSPNSCDHTCQMKCQQEQDYRCGKSVYACPKQLKVSPSTLWARA